MNAFAGGDLSEFVNCRSTNEPDEKAFHPDPADAIHDLAAQPV